MKSAVPSVATEIHKHVKPSLAQISAFVIVVESGGVTAAAGLLGRSPSTVSQHLKEFELASGGPLLRLADGVLVPNDRGRHVYHLCRSVISSHAEVVSALGRRAVSCA